MKESCKQRWRKHKCDCVNELEKLLLIETLPSYSKRRQRLVKTYGILDEYGLSFDYVEGGKGEEGYWRYQISWGGPSEEFRFFASSPRCTPHRIEFAFLDWFDGYSRTLVGADRRVLEQVWDWFADTGAVEQAINEALEETI